MKQLFVVALLLSSSVLFAQDRHVSTVYFDSDQFELNQGSKNSLDQWLASQSALLNNSGTTIELHGHCDARGSIAYNDQLSEKRINTVMNYLQKIYPAISIKITNPHGERAPLNENKTDEDRQLNRRVEIILTSSNITGQKIPLTARETPAVLLKDQLADSNVIAGSKIVLRNINFYGGRHVFLPESFPMLTELLEAMKKNPTLVIQIEGHICCHPDEGDALDIGTGIYNLSTARAWAIQDYLLAKGIEPSRVTHKGFGHSKPIYPYPEENEEQRVENRRVEIRVISR